MSNTTIKTSGVQDVKCKLFDLVLADFVAASNVIDVALPPGAEIVDGNITVTVASDAGTTDVIVLGDSGTANRYIASTTVKSAARLPVVPTGYRVTGAETAALRITRTPVGTAATVLSVTGCIQYVVKGVETSCYD